MIVADICFSGGEDKFVDPGEQYLHLVELSKVTFLYLCNFFNLSSAIFAQWQWASSYFKKGSTIGQCCLGPCGLQQSSGMWYMSIKEKHGLM